MTTQKKTPFLIGDLDIYIFIHGWFSIVIPGCLGYIGDYTTQLYGEFFHDKDPYQTTSIDSIVESQGAIFRGSLEN